MPLITCPDCEKRVSVAAAACPDCGRPMQPSGDSVFTRNRGCGDLIIWPLLAVALAFVIWLVFAGQ